MDIYRDTLKKEVQMQESIFLLSLSGTSDGCNILHYYISMTGNRTFLSAVNPNHLFNSHFVFYGVCFPHACLCTPTK